MPEEVADIMEVLVVQVRLILHMVEAGGSSYISGHNGCNAIKESSTAASIVHTGQPNHYSGLVFTNTIMIDGAGYKWTTAKGAQTAMPKPAGGNYSLGSGHTGNGYAIISKL